VSGNACLQTYFPFEDEEEGIRWFSFAKNAVFGLILDQQGAFLQRRKVFNLKSAPKGMSGNEFLWGLHISLNGLCY
jgi:hypothetical protein